MHCGGTVVHEGFCDVNVLVDVYFSTGCGMAKGAFGPKDIASIESYKSCTTYFNPASLILSDFGEQRKCPTSHGSDMFMHPLKDKGVDIEEK
eukprot:scaffold4343_cov144-Cylindrotheca_fusiformis.AAC.4